MAQVQEKRQASGECRPTKDFLRHVVNHVLAEAADKMPVAVFNDLRASFSRGEDKYGFALFGGNPMRLLDYFASEDWRKLVDYVKNMNVEWVLIKILDALYEAYKDTCPPVAARAKEIAEELRKIEAREKGPTLTPDTVYRTLKMRGYKVERGPRDNVFVIEGTNYNARIEVVDGVIKYTICREGRANTVDALEVKIKKIAEI